MLSHYNLVANVYQTLTPGEYGAIREEDVCCASCRSITSMG